MKENLTIFSLFHNLDVNNSTVEFFNHLKSSLKLETDTVEHFRYHGSPQYRGTLVAAAPETLPTVTIVNS